MLDVGLALALDGALIQYRFLWLLLRIEIGFEGDWEIAILWEARGGLVINLCATVLASFAVGAELLRESK